MYGAGSSSCAEAIVNHLNCSLFKKNVDDLFVTEANVINNKADSVKAAGVTDASS